MHIAAVATRHLLRLGFITALTDCRSTRVRRGASRSRMNGAAFRFAPIFLCAVGTSLSGCAGLQSTKVENGSVIEGVAYHMPMRYFILTVERASGASVKAEWAVSDIYPDASQQYALRFNPHLIGKTEVSIEVNSSGLLGSAKTKVSDSAAALATVTRIPGFKSKGAQQSRTCTATGTEVFVYDAAIEATVCDDVQIAIAKLPSPKIDSSKKVADFRDAGTAGSLQSGVFYKQERPYLVEATTQNITRSKIVLASNDSPVVFLPYGKTLFAANDGQITFSNGIPTSFTQSTDGEFVALLKIPATILSAYFTAVGNVFDAFSSREAYKQSNALERYKLSLAAYKLEKCKDAFEKKDTEAMKILECAALSAQ